MVNALHQRSQGDEVDPNVLDWIKLQEKEKASYEAPWHFQET